jgi:hypothetical protein
VWSGWVLWDFWSARTEKVNKFDCHVKRADFRATNNLINGQFAVPFLVASLLLKGVVSCVSAAPRQPHVSPMGGSAAVELWGYSKGSFNDKNLYL